MRSSNIIKNIIFGLGSTILTTLFSFVVRTLFIYKLGAVYLGVNGLLSNILSMLSLAELGIGSAITFSLYKPLAEKDEVKINSLMAYYKKTYRNIGIFIFVAGILLTPFLNFFIKDGENISNLTIIYLLYLSNTAYSYLFSYKRTIVHSDQKGYIITKYSTMFKIMLSVIQVTYLLIAKNFIVYLILQFGVGVIENIYVNNKINKMHPYLNAKNSKKLDNKELKNIKENINGLMLHKIGGYFISGTDNIIISKFINITSVGLFSNYTMLLSTVEMLINSIMFSFTASFGNMLSTESIEKVYKKFKTLNFINFWMYGFSTIAFYFLLNPFISLWIGDKFQLSYTVILLLCINYYICSAKRSLEIMKIAAGIYKQDKYTTLIQAVINIVISLAFVGKYGLAGVVLGTLMSNIFIALFMLPYYVFKYVFNKNPFNYLKTYFSYTIYYLCQIIFIKQLFNIVNVENDIIEFIIYVIIITIVPNLINLIAFHKFEEFKDLEYIFKRKILRKKV